jgi:enoyl-CoA hydratase
VRRDVGAIAHVTLHHPTKLNAMTRAMWADLQGVFQDIEQESVRGGGVRCVVLRGDGAHFCAGGDIAEYPAFRFDPTALAHFHEVQVWGALSAMLACNVPMLALIDGNCMGAGLEMASCCDVRIAGTSARFGAPIARLGFPMAPREAALVSQAVGLSAARAMLLAAEILGAERLQQQGFLTQVVAPDQLDSVGLAVAQRMAALAPQAARMNKQLLNAQALYPRDVPASTYAYADSAEHREGIRAFLEKRQPEF